mmetsp:Transcript_29548/g.47367  ORF Transcript_29548/g.47367 Transcript_29548/m.47367 type:complete len:286 (+) Transcript_29548:2585-3442(+)
MHTHILPIPDSPFLFSCIMLAYAWIPTRRWFRYYGFGRRQPTKDSSKGGRKEFVSFKTDPSNTTCDSKRRKSGGVTPTPRNKYNESNDVITNASTNLKRPQPLGRESSSSEVLHHQQQQQQQQCFITSRKASGTSWSPTCTTPSAPRTRSRLSPTSAPCCAAWTCASKIPNSSTGPSAGRRCRRYRTTTGERRGGRMVMLKLITVAPIVVPTALHRIFLLLDIATGLVRRRLPTSPPGIPPFVRRRIPASSGDLEPGSHRFSSHQCRLHSSAATLATGSSLGLAS